MCKKVYVDKKSQMSMIARAFEEVGYRCVRIRTECELEYAQRGADRHRHGMMVLDGDRLVLEIVRSRKVAPESRPIH